jgi:hypothetical protein
MLSFEGNKGKGQIPYIAVEILISSDNDLSSFVLFESIHDKVSNYEEEKFMGFDAILYNNLVDNPTAPRDFTKGVFFKKDGFYWDILVLRNNSDQEVSENIYDQILSTLRFNSGL